MKINNKLYIINLERRLDRKSRMINILSEQNISNYEFIVAVDGSKLIPNEKIYQLFYGNDFNYRYGVVGCALSHYNLWKRLLDDTDNDYYIILEDDVNLCNDFNEKMEKIMNQIVANNIPFCSIGGHSNKLLNENIDNLQIIYDDYSGYVEGTLAYVITKDGAKKICDFIQNHSIYRAIDYIAYTAFDMKIHKLNELLVQSFTYQMEGNADTDIQTDYNCLDFSEKCSLSCN